MTNAELIEKIRAEIERLKGIGGIVPLDNREQKTGYESALIDIEIFLDSLESETEKDEKVPSRIYLGSKYEFIRRDIILKEIEGLKKNNEVSDDKEYASYELDVACGYDMACDDILSFLSTLEHKSNPIFDECVAKVDPEVREEVRRNIDIEDELVRYFGRMPEDDEDKIELARHFAKWGAENLKK